jgi:heat shock protein HslJ
MKNPKIFIVLTLSALACSNSTSPGDPALLNSEWGLVEIDLGPVAFDASTLVRTPTIIFGLPVDTKTLEITGTGGCNNFRSEAVVGGGIIEIEDLTQTMRGCDAFVLEIEGLYFGALGSATGYEVTDDQLSIDASNGQSLKFVRIE